MAQKSSVIFWLILKENMPLTLFKSSPIWSHALHLSCTKEHKQNTIKSFSNFNANTNKMNNFLYRITPSE